MANTMSSSTTEAFEPTIVDVLVVKAMLNRAFALPVEIANSVLDMAEYWPHTSTVELVRRTMHGSRNENELLVRRLPLLVCFGNVLSDNDTGPFKTSRFRCAFTTTSTSS
jgi:hypothetical protein